MPSGSAGVPHKQLAGGTSPLAAGTRFQPRIDAVWLARCSGQTALGRTSPVAAGNKAVVFITFLSAGNYAISACYDCSRTLYVPATSAVFCTNTSNGCFTIRNEVAKVMFLQVLSVHGGGVCLSTTPLRSRHPSPGSRHPPRADHPPGAGSRPEQGPPPADGYCCGRYASYWNAFLLLVQN